MLADGETSAGDVAGVVREEFLQEVDAWVEQFRVFWDGRLGALATEVARSKRSRH